MHALWYCHGNRLFLEMDPKCAVLTLETNGLKATLKQGAMADAKYAIFLTSAFPVECSLLMHI